MVQKCAFYIQNNVQETIYEYTSIKYPDNSNHLLYWRVYFTVFYSNCDISMDNSKLLLAYIQLYVDKSLLWIPDLLKNIYYSHLRSGKRSLLIRFHKRDILIKTLYEVYMWSLWRVDFVGILKHIIFSQHQVLFDLFIDLDWLTFITFSMYVCMHVHLLSACKTCWMET